MSKKDIILSQIKVQYTLFFAVDIAYRQLSRKPLVLRGSCLLRFR